MELVIADFDVLRAETALQMVVDRHDMLRSVLDRTGHQRVLDDVPPIRIAETDLADLGPAGRRAAVAAERDRLVRRETRPDLWVPLEAHALHLGGGRTTLMISIDMVKLDAWSAQLLLAEWFLRYDDTRAAVPRPELTFRDYVLWTEAVRTSTSCRQARRYWLDRLPTLPAAPELPLLAALETVDRPAFRSRGIRLPREDWQRLEGRAAEQGLTPSMLLCAAYAEVLGTWSRHRHFTLSVAGGRPAAHPDLARVIGPFARPTLLEVDGAGVDLRDRARAVQRRFSRDLEHRDFGGLDVLRELAARDGRTRATMPVIFLRRPGRPGGPRRLRGPGPRARSRLPGGCLHGPRLGAGRRGAGRAARRGGLPAPGPGPADPAARGPRAGGRSLVAFVVTDLPVPSAELHRFLVDRLPRHAVPDRIVEIDSVPLTPNGKVDRAALGSAAAEPPPAGAAPQVAVPGVARTLVVLLQELLGVEAGIDDDFFELGGNSLVAVQLAARAQDAGLPLTAACVMRHPSVGALAAALPPVAPQSA